MDLEKLINSIEEDRLVTVKGQTMSCRNFIAKYYTDLPKSEEVTLKNGNKISMRNFVLEFLLDDYVKNYSCSVFKYIAEKLQVEKVKKKTERNMSEISLDMKNSLTAIQVMLKEMLKDYEKSQIKENFIAKETNFEMDKCSILSELCSIYFDYQCAFRIYRKNGSSTSKIEYHKKEAEKYTRLITGFKEMSLQEFEKNKSIYEIIEYAMGKCPNKENEHVEYHDQTVNNRIKQWLDEKEEQYNKIMSLDAEISSNRLIYRDEIDSIIFYSTQFLNDLESLNEQILKVAGGKIEIWKSSVSRVCEKNMIKKSGFSI